MKVLQINVVCGRGSTGRIVTDLDQTLTAAGHSCRIAYGRGNAPEDAHAWRMDPAWEPPLHAGLSRITDRVGFYSAASTRRLVRNIRLWKPDIIHLHVLHGYYIHVGELFSALATLDTPVIWTFHDCWAFTGHCVYFDLVGCNEWQNQCGPCPQTRSYPQSLLFDASPRNFAIKRKLFTAVQNLTIVTPSHWLAALTERSFFKGTPIRVIPNGIDDDTFKPTPNTVKRELHVRGRLVLGVANVWDDRKGLPDFIRLRELLPSEDVIALCGLPSSQSKSLPRGIIAIPRTNSPQALAGLYSAADVFVNPTYEDNFPSVNIEALSCGTPVVTYKTGGSAECLAPHCGTAVSQGDITSLAKAILTHTKTPDSQRHCCDRATHFTRATMHSAYLNLYQEVLA